MRWMLEFINISLFISNTTSHLIYLDELSWHQSLKGLIYLLNSWPEDCYLLVDEFWKICSRNRLSFLHYSDNVGLYYYCVVSLRKGFYLLDVLFLRCDEFVWFLVLIIQLVSLIHLIDRYNLISLELINHLRNDILISL
jgi:hypothetical protein